MTGDPSSLTAQLGGSRHQGPRGPDGRSSLLPLPASEPDARPEML